MSGFSVELNTL